MKGLRATVVTVHCPFGRACFRGVGWTAIGIWRANGDAVRRCATAVATTPTAASSI